MALEREGLIDKNSCINEKTVFQLNTDYLKDFMNTYSESGFFGMLHLNQYSHNSLEHISWIDNDLLDFLKEFNSNLKLKQNTILILYSDHGPRFTANRKSIKGLLEERNPMFSFYIPKLIKEKYPKYYKNIKKNINRLTTPMDIYNTLNNMIYLQKNTYKPYRDNRSLNLFDEIPKNRNCKQAGISLHWCMCLKRTELFIDDKLNLMANEFVNYLNSFLLKDHLDKCEILSLLQINKVYLYESNFNNEDSKKQNEIIKKQAQSLGLNMIEMPKIETGYKKFFFQVTLYPNNAMYEFTIIIEDDLVNQNKESNIKFNTNQISRINKYGKTSACIYNSVPSIRQYCFCKNQNL